ncbi:MAG: translocation/assembly module TamB domain-containing protein [Deltaproteobacteria bacterium]|nr:translocation/assembly module TamB domain-containing protein [Deltaproteobacteria bacterium]
MKKGFFKFGLVVVALYAVLHVILGSSPVQRRVLGEIRRALEKYGIDLQIDSIEFSAFTPKVYLNRVQLKTTLRAPVQLAEIITIDKIKFEFQPIALLSRQIVINEAVFFHPTIVLPKADQLLREVQRVAHTKGRSQLSGGMFSLVIKKIGAVDALLNISSADPKLNIRSRSLSLFVQNSASRQQTVSIDSPHLEITYGPSQIAFNKVNCDFDLTSKSVRINHAEIGGNDFSLQVKGTSSLPLTAGKLTNLNISYQLSAPLGMVQRLWVSGVPKVDGIIQSSGVLSILDGSPQGNGEVSYRDVTLNGYKLGGGSFNYVLKSDRKLHLSNLRMKYGGGTLTAVGLAVTLQDRFPIEGEMLLNGINLEGILDSLKCPNAPVRMALNGTLKVSGFLSGPFDLQSDMNATVSQFAVLEKNSVERIVEFDKGHIEGKLEFLADRMQFNSRISVLEGRAITEGYVAFDNTAKVSVKGESLSLTSLGHISTLNVGGRANLVAEIEVGDEGTRVGGQFDVVSSEVSNIMLGHLKGSAFFNNDLLSFDKLESMEPGNAIVGSGFVDFRPKETHYRFDADAKRAEVNHIFSILRKQKLSFRIAETGEVAGKVRIEGGHDGKGIEISSVGEARDFSWYDERWVAGAFNIHYRPNQIALDRVMLLKKTGGLEIRARFDDSTSQLRFISHGLRLEELSACGQAPLMAEVSGELSLEGDMSRPTGQGEITLRRTVFRGLPLANSSIFIRTEGSAIEVIGYLVGERLRARLKRGADKTRWEALAYFSEFDVMPLVSVLLGKDIPTLTSVMATGDFAFEGDWRNWSTAKGSGTISQLSLGLKGTPMENSKPINVKIDRGAIKINRSLLVGIDSQFSFDLIYQPNQVVNASLDGKVDLQYLQPFIPGLEYGTGKVSAGIRMSGQPRNFHLLGNLALEDGVVRLGELPDEFRNVQAQLSLSQDRVSLDLFQAEAKGGTLTATGDVRINRFKDFAPNIKLSASRLQLHPHSSLAVRLSGDFFIRGDSLPFELGGKCQLLEGALTRFDLGEVKKEGAGTPTFRFDIACDAKEKVMVRTEIMNAEFRGNFHLLGNTQQLGLLGTSELIRGTLLFREKKFALGTGTVRFESASQIAPRFNLSGSTLVKELKLQAPQQYEVNLHVFGTPDDYKLRLSSSPALAETDIISLLLLGVTTRGQEGTGEGNYVDLGTTLVGQIPIQSKLQSELGVDVTIAPQAGQSQKVVPSDRNPVTSFSSGDITVPSVQIQKDVTNKTKLSYSNTLETAPVREFKVEHMLNESFTLNGSVVDKAKTSTDSQTTQSYGVDLRYRFLFE